MNYQYEVCNYCGMIHNHICLKIKSIEYYENGQIKKVEFRDDVIRNDELTSFSKPYISIGGQY